MRAVLNGGLCRWYHKAGPRKWGHEEWRPSRVLWSVQATQSGGAAGGACCRPALGQQEQEDGKGAPNANMGIRMQEGLQRDAYSGL